jgi:hypothetical protein
MVRAADCPHVRYNGYDRYDRERLCPGGNAMTPKLDSLVFVGLNSRIAALDRNTGATVWQWRAAKPRSGGYVSLLLLDESRLIASVNGYTYCLDPLSGGERWCNELPGFGTGVTAIAALGRTNVHDLLLAAAAADAAAAAASASATTSSG